jgi:hypothetical protein
MPKIPSDYLPDSYENRLKFLKALKLAIHKYDGELKLDAARLTAIDALLDPLIAKYQAAVDAAALLRQTTASATEAFTEANTDFRALVNELKNNPGFDDGIGEEMGVASTATQRQDSAIKPRLTATGHRGGVTLDGSKDYAETVNLYMRILGETVWRLIAIKRKRLPFEDQLPPAKPGTPEVREYMARGVIGDDEVGQESDIVTATFTP